MPFLIIHTNAEAKDAKVFLNEATDFIASELRKPKNYVIVSLDVNLQMAFGGSCDCHGALVEMQSVGFGDKEDLAKKITDFLVSRLNLQRDMVNILFTNISAADLSIGGSLLG